jgi:hypothetical protein
MVTIADGFGYEVLATEHFPFRDHVGDDVIGGLGA